MRVPSLPHLGAGPDGLSDELSVLGGEQLLQRPQWLRHRADLSRAAVAVLVVHGQLQHTVLQAWTAASAHSLAGKIGIITQPAEHNPARIQANFSTRQPAGKVGFRTQSLLVVANS